MDYSDVAPEIEAKLRAICLAFPDAYEEKAWAGSRWLIRRRNFAFCLGVDDRVVVVFRSAPPELDALAHAGHPFFSLGEGKNVVGMVIDDNTDWQELSELLSDSYCLMAPKKLAALVNGGSD